ncbi:MAG: hypothetical protein ABII80_02235, partial [bacterium]
MAENSGPSIEEAGLSHKDTQSFKNSYEFDSPAASIMENIFPEIEAYNGGKTSKNLFSLEAKQTPDDKKWTLKIKPPKGENGSTASSLIELDFSGQDGTKLKTNNNAEALLALQSLKTELDQVKDSFGALRTLVGEKAQKLIETNMTPEDHQALLDLKESQAKATKHKQEVADANKLGGPQTASPELTNALKEHDKLKEQPQELDEGTILSDNPNFDQGEYGPEDMPWDKKDKPEEISEPEKSTTKTAKEREDYFEINKEQLTKELVEVKEAIHELTTELRKRGIGESFLTKVANKLRGVGPNPAELDEIISSGGLPDWTSPEAITNHKMVTNSEALQQNPKLAIELKGYQDRLRALAGDLPQSILDDPENGFPGIFTELYPDGLPTDSTEQNPVEEIIENTTKDTTNDSLVKEEPNVDSSTETQQVHEKYPRWIDDPERKISSKEFTEKHQEKIDQTKEIILNIQSEFKESHPEEYEKIFGGEDINPYDILQDRIREQGKYSQGLDQEDVLAKLVQEKLSSQGISAPEFLMTSEYLSRQHEYAELIEASKAAETGNEQAFKRRVRRIQKKYGNKAARRAVSSAVGGGEFGSPLFIHEDLSKEMSMTAEETRLNGYQDLRALQIVKDRVLDTWDPEARARWAQYETDGSVVTLETESKKLDAVLTKVLTKEQDKLTPKELEILGVIETLQKESVDEALSKFTGLTPEDGETTLKSIARWREEKGVEPYTPLELKQLTLKGLNLRDRRSSPRTTKEITPVPPQPDFDIYYQVFQEQPDLAPEPVPDPKPEPESEPAYEPTITDSDYESTITEPDYEPTITEVEDRDPVKSFISKVLAIVGYSPLELAKLDMAGKLMEENQPPGMIARAVRGWKEIRASGQGRVAAFKEAMKGVGEWAKELGTHPGEYLRRIGRNTFKHHIWRSWYNREYENHSRDVLRVAGTHLAEESFFLAREQAKKELYGDGYLTGGELGFGGRLKARLKSPILGSERELFKRTLTNLEGMRQRGEIVEVAAHEKSDDALLTRFTYESEALIHKA